MAVKKALTGRGERSYRNPLTCPVLKPATVFYPGWSPFLFYPLCPGLAAEIICGIYVSTFKNGSWQKPVPLPPAINDPNFTARNLLLAVRQNQTVRSSILFRTGRSRGGMDIWYTVWDDKETYTAKSETCSKVNTTGMK